MISCKISRPAWDCLIFSQAYARTMVNLWFLPILMHSSFLSILYPIALYKGEAQVFISCSSSCCSPGSGPSPSLPAPVPALFLSLFLFLSLSLFDYDAYCMLEFVWAEKKLWKFITANRYMTIYNYVTIEIFAIWKICKQISLQTNSSIQYSVYIPVYNIPVYNIRHFGSISIQMALDINATFLLKLRQEPLRLRLDGRYSSLTFSTSSASTWTGPIAT